MCALWLLSPTELAIRCGVSVKLIDNPKMDSRYVIFEHKRSIQTRSFFQKRANKLNSGKKLNQKAKAVCASNRIRNKF
jgi:hypothetical protein